MIDITEILMVGTELYLPPGIASARLILISDANKKKRISCPQLNDPHNIYINFNMKKN